MDKDDLGMKKLNKKLGWLLSLLLMSLAAVVTAADMPFGKGMLFAVTKDGAAPSYVFGTIHTDDERVTRLPPDVKEAIASAEHVAVEVEMDESALLMSAAALVFSDGRDLPSMLGKELYRRTAKVMTKRGIPEIALRQLKPWAVVTMLSVPPAKNGLFLDLLIYRMARDMGVKISGLETVSEQLSLFDRLSDREQVSLLKETLNNLDQLPIVFENLIKTYLERDLAGLVRITEDMASFPDPEMEKRFREKLIDRRNERMVKAMQPMLEKGGLFVAVGALHLPGKHGILSQLQGLGYSLERVY